MESMSRDAAWELLRRYNESEALLRHALAVEGVMRRFAREMGEDEDYWGVVGLIHDLDYEKYPDEHCRMTERIMREEGLPEALIHAVISHGWGLCGDVEPTLPMENVLYTIDELTGLVNAAAIMRPSKSVMDLEVKSVRKKFTTPSFAAGVNRTVIETGAARMNMPLDDVIERVILGMRDVAEEIWLL